MLHLCQRLLGLDVRHRHVGDAREHGVEAARELAQLVLALHARADEELAQLGPGHDAGEALDRLEQEMTRRERDGHAGEREGEKGPEDCAGPELVERHRWVANGKPVAVGDERPQARQQHDRRRNG